MGFFSDLGKAFMGKPLGQDAQSSQSQPAQSSAPQEEDGLRDERGLKIIPDIEVKNLKSDRMGEEKLIVRAWIQNNTDIEIRIEWTYLLKQKNTQNQFIGPRESKEIKLYDGKIPDNDNEGNAQIAFKITKNNDVFMENYRVDFFIEADGKFKVSDLIDDGPTRDL